MIVFWCESESVICFALFDCLTVVCYIICSSDWLKIDSVLVFFSLSC